MNKILALKFHTFKIEVEDSVFKLSLLEFYFRHCFSFSLATRVYYRVARKQSVETKRLVLDPNSTTGCVTLSKLFILLVPEFPQL